MERAFSSKAASVLIGAPTCSRLNTSDSLMYHLRVKGTISRLQAGAPAAPNSDWRFAAQNLFVAQAKRPSSLCLLLFNGISGPEARP